MTVISLTQADDAFIDSGRNVCVPELPLIWTRLTCCSHGEPYRHFSAIIGWKSLTDSIDHFGHDHEFTKLVLDLKGKDPDDAFSSIPYEKGFNFLFHIENLVGKQRFDKFIPHVCQPQATAVSPC